MISIESTLYRPLARLLAGRLAAASFFNGRVEYETEEFVSEFIATLIVYRDGERITDVVPVWWEFHLHQECGEVATDFCWRELRAYLEEYFD